MDRETLAKRAGVRVEDVDDVIGLAGKLQEEDRAARGASVDEVKLVASELDIDPQFVEAAVLRLKDDRARAETERAAVLAAENATSDARKRIAGIVAAALLGVSVLIGGGGAIATVSSARAVHEQQVATTLAAGDLAVVLDRQLALVPQLIGLAGGDVASVKAARDQALGAESLDDRLRGSLLLDAALGEAVAALPPTDVAEIVQNRKDLQYELVGSRNRIDTERRRWEEARGAWENAASTPGGRLATGLGLAVAPDRR